MKRRTFLGGLLGAAAAVAGGVWWWVRGRPVPEDVGPGPGGEVTGPVTAPDGRPVFPALHRETLRQLVSRLVPDEPGAVGAETAGAFGYVERQMALPDMQGARRTAMRGASVLDKLSRSRFQTLFSRVQPDQQDAVITAMFEGEGSSPKLNSEDFLKLMLGLTLEGMFCDPKWGGNKDGAGWGSIGYLMHPPRPGDCHPGVEECED